jgi:hypothetical protein
VLRKYPPVPSATVVYKTTLTTTTNEDTTTWTAVDIGVPHPRRIIVVPFYAGAASLASLTINEIPYYWVRQNATPHEFGIFAVAVPCETTATVVMTATSSLRKAAGIYVAYPQSHMWLDFAAATANASTNAVATDQKAQAGGFLIYSGGQHATVGAFTTTWSGPEAVTEDVDAQLEAAASYTFGHIDFTVSSDANDLTLAETVSGTKRLVTVTFGPPEPSAGIAF